MLLHKEIHSFNKSFQFGFPFFICHGPGKKAMNIGYNNSANFIKKYTSWWKWYTKKILECWKEVICC